MKRSLIAVAVFAVLAIAIGFMLSGKEDFAWGVALGLFGLALIGEGLRLWIKRGRATKRETRQSPQT